MLVASNSRTLALPAGVRVRVVPGLYGWACVTLFGHILFLFIALPSVAVDPISLTSCCCTTAVRCCTTAVLCGTHLLDPGLPRTSLLTSFLFFLPFFSEWPEIKPTTPRGSAPVLTLDDGTTVTESVAILRYAGKLGTPRLYPEDPVAALRVDEMVDIIGSTTAILSKTFGLPSEEQLAMRTKIMSEDGELTKVLKFVDEAAKANGSGFLVGSELTIADCALRPAVYWLTAGILDGIPKDCLDQYKGLAKVMQTMSEIPAIKRYESEQYSA